MALLTCFRFDSPVELKAKGKTDKLRELMTKMYHSDLIESRIEAIAGGAEE